MGTSLVVTCKKKREGPSEGYFEVLSHFKSPEKCQQETSIMLRMELLNTV